MGAPSSIAYIDRAPRHPAPEGSALLEPHPDMFNTLAALTLGSLAVLSTPVHADQTWFDDFDAAAAAAKEQGKDLLVDFTGSDWCGWCIKLHDEVFQHDTWMESAQKDYILVALDFPRAEEIKAKVPNPERNEELQAKYGVRGFPTILMMTADGEVYGRTGYQAGGPEKYLEHMQELRKGREQLMAAKTIASDFEAASDDAGRWKLWLAAVTIYEEAPSGAPFLPSLDAPVRFALTADADNKKGSKGRTVLALLKSGLATEADIAMAAGLDPKNDLGMMDYVADAKFSVVRDDVSARAALVALDQVNELGFKDTELAFRLNFQAANWCAGPLSDDEGKVKYATKAKAIGSDSKEQLAMLDEWIG